MRPTALLLAGISICAAVNSSSAERRIVSVKIEPAFAQAKAHFMPTPWNVELRLYRYDTRAGKYLFPTRRVASQQAGITGGEVQFTVDVLTAEAGVDAFYRVVCLGGSHYYDGISDEIPVEEKYTENVRILMRTRDSGGQPRDEYRRDPKSVARFPGQTTASRSNYERRVYVLDSPDSDLPAAEAFRVFAGTWRDGDGNEFILHQNWTVSGVLGDGNWTTKSPRQMKEIFGSFHNFRNLVIYDPQTLEVRKKYDIPYGPVTASEDATYHGMSLSAGQNAMGISPNPVTHGSASEIFRRVSQ